MCTFVFTLALLLVLGCGRASSDVVLRVGTSGEYPPFTFVEASELQGIEIADRLPHRHDGRAVVRSSVQRAQLVPVATLEDGIEALRAEKTDYFIHDAPTIWRIVGGFDSSESQLTGLYRPLTQKHIGWAVRRDDAALAEQLGASLARWRRERRSRSGARHLDPRSPRAEGVRLSTAVRRGTHRIRGS